MDRGIIMKKIISFISLFVISYLLLPGCGGISPLIPPSYKPVDRTNKEVSDAWSDGNRYTVTGLSIFNGELILYAGNSQTLTVLPAIGDQDFKDSTQIYLVYNLDMENSAKEDITVPISQVFMQEQSGKKWPVIFYQNMHNTNAFNQGLSNVSLKPGDVNRPGTINQAVMSNIKGNIDTSALITVKPGKKANYNFVFSTGYKYRTELPDSVSLHLTTNIGLKALVEKMFFNKTKIE